MTRGFRYLQNGEYFGPYNNLTLIKGPFFPLLLYLINLCHLSYSCAFSCLYILASLFLTLSLSNVIKNKKYLVCIYFLLLFNPAAYSQDLFQRLYRNSISMTEFLFFFGCVVGVLFTFKKEFLNYFLLGLSLAIMFLTREDNLWVYPILLFVFVYTFFKNKRWSTFILNTLPFVILIGSLNLVSYINYRHYGIYTYNEIQKSAFHDTYKKILQIKDGEKIPNVAIPRSTLYLLSEKLPTFRLTPSDIDRYYNRFADESGEIYNGNLIWYFRSMIFHQNKKPSGSESEAYYRQLGAELDQLFANKTLEKEFVMPSIFMSVPTLDDLMHLPGNVFQAIIYATTYKNIKTMIDTQDYIFDQRVTAFMIIYDDYHYTVNLTPKNALRYEITRFFYQYLTPIMSILALFIYGYNFTKFDSRSILCHLLVTCYLLIIGGIAYTHTTSFHAIRPLYLGNIYLIQSLFILISLSRIKFSCLLSALKK
ncbi:hypothetical protein IJJ27_04440 [bacterium]|nr:hypothetical protein [bacterium]